MTVTQNARPLSKFWSEFKRHPVAVIAAFVVIIIILLAIFAPLIAPQDPYDLSSLVLRDGRRAPGYIGQGGYTHILGTDGQGRDLFSAILYGLRISQLKAMAG